MAETLHPRSRIEATLFSQRLSAPVVLTPHLTSYQFSKSLGSPAGSIVLGLKSHRDYKWLRLIEDDDWIVIHTQGPYDAKRVIVAFVDSVAISAQTDPTGTIRTDTVVQCSDVGKPFEKHEFLHHPGLPQDLPGFVNLTTDLWAAMQATALFEPRAVLQLYYQRVFRPVRVRVKTTAASPAAVAQAKADIPKPPGSASSVAGKGQPPLTKGQLTENFHIQEFIRKNAPLRPELPVQANLQTLAGYLQILRDEYFGGAAVTIVSGWRHPSRNNQPGQAVNSYHLQGKAADISVAGMDARAVGDAIKQAIEDQRIPYGGLFLYSTFVHYDYGDGGGGKPRPAIGHGTGTDAPSAAQLSGWEPWTPSFTPEPTPLADSDDDLGETKIQTEYAAESVTEMVSSESGDGAWRVPLTLHGSAATLPPEQTSPRRWDWIDVVDLTTWMERPSAIYGRWWSPVPLIRMDRQRVHDFIAPQTDSVFNELFYDTRPVGSKSTSILAEFLKGWAPAVIYRRRPFDKLDWQRLDRCGVPGKWIRSASISKGGAERFDFFLATPSGVHEMYGPYVDQAIYGGNGQIPMMPKADIYAHGLRALALQSPFIATPDIVPDAEPLDGEVVKLTAALFRWYYLAPQYLGGTIEFPYFDPHALVGNKLEITGGPIAEQYDDIQGYIEAVQESAQIDPTTGVVAGVSTQISFSRGQPLAQYVEPAYPSPWKKSQP